MSPFWGDLLRSAAQILPPAAAFGLAACCFVVGKSFRSPFFIGVAATWALSFVDAFTSQVVAPRLTVPKVEFASYVLGLLPAFAAAAATAQLRRGARWLTRSLVIRSAWWFVASTGCYLTAKTYALAPPLDHAASVAVGVAYSGMSYLVLARALYRRLATDLLDLLLRPEHGVRWLRHSERVECGSERRLTSDYQGAVKPHIIRCASRAREFLWASIAAYGALQFAFLVDPTWVSDSVPRALWIAGFLCKCTFGLGVAYLVRAGYLHEQAVLTDNREFAYIGALASCVEHDVRHPLSTIESALEVWDARSRARRADPGESILRIRRQVERIRAAIQLIPRFKGVFEFSVDMRNQFDVADAVGLAVSDAQLGEGATQVRVEVNNSGDGPLAVRGDRGLMTNAISNLIRNSVEAYAERRTPGVIEIDIGIGTEREVVVRVRDRAGGIRRDVLEALPRPLVSTKGTKSGRYRGLGLFSATKVVELHGGQLFIRSDSRTATEITIRVPRAPSDGVRV